MGDPDKIEKISKYIIESGYPLEIEVLKMLQNTDWTVIPQHVYQDPDESKRRTLDFLCFKRYTIKSKLYTGFRAALFIECKTIERYPWVLFTIKKPERMNEPLHQFNFLKIYERRKLNTLLDIDKLLPHCHYFKKDRIAINHCIAHRKREGKDRFYEALNQSIKALAEDKKSISEILVKLSVPDIYLFSIGYPIIICEKELYEYKIETNEIIEANHLLYRSSGLAQSEGPFLIDVMKLDNFPSYLQDIEEEINSLVSTLENM